MKQVIAAALVGGLLLSGCASNAEHVSASYVSPTQFSNLDCDQIRLELMGISQRVASLSAAQNRKARNDKIATGVGIVIFWPALFFLMSDDDKAELSSLKGQYDALNNVATVKKCDVASEIRAQTPKG